MSPIQFYRSESVTERKETRSYYGPTLVDPPGTSTFRVDARVIGEQPECVVRTPPVSSERCYTSDTRIQQGVSIEYRDDRYNSELSRETTVGPNEQHGVCSQPTVTVWARAPGGIGALDVTLRNVRTFPAFVRQHGRELHRQIAIFSDILERPRGNRRLIIN